MPRILADLTAPSDPDGFEAVRMGLDEANAIQAEVTRRAERILVRRGGSLTVIPENTQVSRANPQRLIHASRGVCLKGGDGIGQNREALRVIAHVHDSRFVADALTGGRTVRLKTHQKRWSGR